MTADSPAARPSLARDERGSIGMIGVLCMGAFACLLFALLNLGIAVTEKVELQNASDASVISGATMVARGLNLIALNNNTQAKLLSLATIWFGLYRAIPIMEKVHMAYELACKALALIPFVGAALSVGCTIIVNIAKFILAVWKALVNATQSIFDYPNGLVWKLMKLLERFSAILAEGIPALAAVEAFRIAVANGADFGLMISPKFLLKPTTANLFLVDFPVRKGTFRDLCGPAKALTAETRKGLLMTILWDIGVDPIAGGIGKFLGGTGVAGAILNGMIEARYRSQCGGDASAKEFTVPAELSVCRQQGGRATWDYKEATIDLDPGEPVDPSPDPMLETGRDVVQFERVMPCSQIPPGKKINSDPEQYQRVVQIYDNGIPRRIVAQRVYQYAFVKAESVEKSDGGSFDQGDSNLPKPYMLDNPPSEAQERLNYFGFTYREKKMAVAPTVLQDMVWGDVRLAYAAVRVYNASEFGSFSQDWRVKLVPADLDTFTKAAGPASALSAAPPGLSKFATILERIRESVPTNH